MHVHVSHPDGEAKFRLQPEVQLATQTGFAAQVVNEPQRLVEEHRRRSSMPGTSTPG